LILKPCSDVFPAEILGQKITKGTFVNVSMFAIHMNEKYWPQGQSFIPERFSEEAKASEHRHPYSYFPFSAGPRNCIGFRFALQEATVLLASVMQNFDVVTNTNDRVLMVADGSITPKGLKVKYLPRNRSA
jgi:cytochrome P450